MTLSSYERRERDENLATLERRLVKTNALRTKDFVEFWELVHKYAHKYWAIDFFTELADLLLKYAGFPDTPLLTHLYHVLSHSAKYHYDNDIYYHELIARGCVPIHMEERYRFEHTWICAPPGSGKTTLMKNFIASDLEKVKAGQASVVVMDSQGDKDEKELFGDIKKWAILDHIDTITLDTHTPFNIFSIANYRAVTEDDHDILYNSAISLINYIFSSSSGEQGKLTKKQSVPFNRCVQLLLAIPGATIADFEKLLLPKGLDAYRQYLPNLDIDGQEFFETRFTDEKFYGETKKEIGYRLDSVLSIKAFRRMFTQSKNFDLYQALSKPKLILVNTNKALLQDEGTETFGRFFLALLTAVSQQRAVLDSHHRLPVYCYVDECQEYISDDPKIDKILSQARKQNVAMILAHHNEEQIKSPSTLSALRQTRYQFTVPKIDFHFNFLNSRTGTTVLVGSPPQMYPRRMPREASAQASPTSTFIHHGEIIQPAPKHSKLLPRYIADEDDDTAAR